MPEKRKGKRPSTGDEDEESSPIAVNGNGTPHHVLKEAHDLERPVQAAAGEGDKKGGGYSVSRLTSGAVLFQQQAAVRTVAG